MGIDKNIEIVRKVLGNGLAVEPYLTDDAVWKIPGIGTFSGMEEISSKLLAPMHKLMESMGLSVITNIVAQDDCVVVESYAEGRVTKTGKPYNNTYCHVYRFRGESIYHVTEYTDTALAKSVFAD